MKKILIWGIRFYQLIGPFIVTGSCRFYPSCSQYAISAIEKFGIAKGISMAFRRLCQCHPFSTAKESS